MQWDQQDCSVGQITSKSVKPCAQKYSAFQNQQIRFITLPSAPPKGAFRDRHETQVRDAVDADVPLTNGIEADGKDVWS
jgi:hypothetical protein